MFSMGTEVHSFEWAVVPSETQEKGLCSILKLQHAQKPQVQCGSHCGKRLLRFRIDGIHMHLLRFLYGGVWLRTDRRSQLHKCEPRLRSVTYGQF